MTINLKNNDGLNGDYPDIDTENDIDKNALNSKNIYTVLIKSNHNSSLIKIIIYNVITI